MNALNRMAEVIENTEMLEEVAVEIFEEDFNLCEAIALNGVDLIQDGDNILTYCNTGGLATSGIGTALGIIKRAHESKKKIHVYVPETRPLLQGARLTAWECEKYKIPFTLICDNMIGTLMKQKKIDKVFVGADRIALNGDFANKIGTYSVSVLAKHHKIPFYVAAPFTTIDFNCKSGDAIPIEERSKDEVLLVNMKNVSVYNPAFDVTNGDNVTAFILDQGVFSLEKFIETFA
jgi:methylthioribose-1-phosphate isomerase